MLLNYYDTKALKKLEAKDRPKTTTGTFWCMHCRRFERLPSYFATFKGLKALKQHLENT